MVVVRTQARTRLVRLLGMLGSAHDGEIANAGRLASQLLRDLGLTWGDIIVPASWDGLNRRERDLRDVEKCLDRPELFGAKTRTFLVGLAAWLNERGPLTQKQRAALDQILERAEGRERRAA
jgi:hypothetical protein